MLRFISSSYNYSSLYFTYCLFSPLKCNLQERSEPICLPRIEMDPPQESIWLDEWTVDTLSISELLQPKAAHPTSRKPWLKSLIHFPSSSQSPLLNDSGDDFLFQVSPSNIQCLILSSRLINQDSQKTPLLTWILEHWHLWFHWSEEIFLTCIHDA